MISEKEAVVIGGQGDKQAFCKDSIWYLNMGRFFLLLSSYALWTRDIFLKYTVVSKVAEIITFGTEGFKQMHGKLS